jgi:hypothetical protein
MDKISNDVLKTNFCVKDFKFMSVMISKGLDRCDGILGLSAKDYG